MARIHETDEKENKGAVMSMIGGATGFLQRVKRRIELEFNDDERFAFNMKLARALGLFGGSIFVMRNIGDVVGDVTGYF